MWDKNEDPRENIRAILIKYNSPEFGDAIVDEILESLEGESSKSKDDENREYIFSLSGLPLTIISSPLTTVVLLALIIGIIVGLII